LFGAYAWVNRSADLPITAAEQEIRIGMDEVAWLAKTWTAQRGRLPTQQELRALIGDYVNEQLLAREAITLGLDKNDLIVRWRLAQKMTFILKDTWSHANPSLEEARSAHQRMSVISHRRDVRHG
jgi:hypothetical protein